MASSFLQQDVPSVGSALTQPQLPIPGAAPTDPSQVGLWQKFQQRLAQDPNLRMALLTTGLNLLKSPQGGQSGFDVFSNAALTGVGTLDQLRQRDLGNERLNLEEGRRDTELGLAERRTAATEANTAEVRTRTRQDATQFDATMKLYRDRLKEETRQFNQRKEAGQLGGAGDTTGQERLINRSVEALIGTRTYPDTKEGRDQAFLAVQPIAGGAISDRDKFKFASEIAAGILAEDTRNRLFNENLPPLDMAEVARRSAVLSEEMFKQFAPKENSSNNYEGRTLNIPSKGGLGTVILISPGKYRIDFPGDVSYEVNEENLKKLMEKYGG